MKKDISKTKSNKNTSFKVDMTPTWGFIAELIMTMLDINTNINNKPETRKNIKEQLIHMSQVADRCVAMDKAKTEKD